MTNINRLLTKSVEQILPTKDSLKDLISRKKIRVYLGVDPTGPRLHLGHSIGLKKLQEFSELGHEAILLFGTGTVLAGDPSQRLETRKKIATKEIEDNIQTWKKQAEKIIDFTKIKIKRNGDWLLKLNLAEILNIASKLSATQAIKRDMFQARIKGGGTVWLHEALYPMLQGYDSVIMDIDLEIGGTDQTFNMLIGRELQKKMEGREKFVLTTPLISGTDGKPMSKSSGNCIWLDDTPQEMFGKIMSMSDSQIEEYWENLTDLPSNKLNKEKPLEAKKELATEIVKAYSDNSRATQARKEFENTIQKGQRPMNAKNIKISNPNQNLVNFLTKNKLAVSNSEAKRLIANGAIEIDGKTIKETQFNFKSGQVIRIGKKNFIAISLSK